MEPFVAWFPLSSNGLDGSFTFKSWNDMPNESIGTHLFALARLQWLNQIQMRCGWFGAASGTTDQGLNFLSTPSEPPMAIAHSLQFFQLFSRSLAFLRELSSKCVGSLVNHEASSFPSISQGHEGDWMAIARGEVGQHECAGRGSNSRIVEYHKAACLRASDETPWCSSFVNWVMAQAGHTGTHNASARSWASWGQEVQPNAARKGDVVVLHRRGGDFNACHVGFLADGGAGHLKLLGGNQSNQVKVSAFPASKWEVLAVRRPRQKNHTA